MTKHYLPESFNIDDGEQNNVHTRCDFRTCISKTIVFSSMMFLMFGGGTFIGFNVNRMPGDHAGYVVNDDGAISIYYPDSIYFISPYVTLKLVDISDRNLTIRDRQCLVTITNIRRFITAVHHNNDSTENLKRNISSHDFNTLNSNHYGINTTCSHSVSSTNTSLANKPTALPVPIYSGANKPTTKSSPQPQSSTRVVAVNDGVASNVTSST